MSSIQNHLVQILADVLYARQIKTKLTRAERLTLEEHVASISVPCSTCHSQTPLQQSVWTKQFMNIIQSVSVYRQ